MPLPFQCALTPPPLETIHLPPPGGEPVIPGECGSASRRFLRFSRLSQVHASRKLTAPSRTSILTAAARAFGPREPDASVHDLKNNARGNAFGEPRGGLLLLFRFLFTVGHTSDPLLISPGRIRPLYRLRSFDRAASHCARFARSFEVEVHWMRRRATEKIPFEHKFEPHLSLRQQGI